MKKFGRFEQMNVPERRRFLKNLGLVLASPLIPADLRFACNEILMGSAFAEAQEASRPTFFIEINLRDQWDFGHVFVAPGIATYQNLVRGVDDDGVALFDDPSTLKRMPNNVYLAREGLPLEPHLDTIALVDLCELSMGTVHGHEAANCTRSPGRSYDAGPGRLPMWLLDPRGGRVSAEDHYSSTPTPAVLHNYFQRQLNRSIRPGVVYKGIARGISMACYHFSADLRDAQLDRFQSTESMVSSFANVAPAGSILTDQAGVIAELLGMADLSFAKRFRLGQTAQKEHIQQVDGFGQRLGQRPPIFNLALTPEERAYWSNGVPEDGHNGESKAHIWEQVAYAAKLISNRVVQTVAIEYDYEDLHSDRDERVLRALGLQTSLPLSRLIETLKAAGVYDDTIIAIYTLDGGRSPISRSTGAEGKNSVMLAGGKINSIF